jgi:hypothetical protein
VNGENALIYTVAIGARYRELAGLMVRSLRRYGFPGGIAVLCDVPLDIPRALADHYPIDAHRLAALDMAGPAAVYLRTIADRLIPGFFRHDYVMHIDADVLCTGRPDIILKDASVTRQVGVQKYPRPLCTAAQDFTAWDLRRARARERAGQFAFAACAGIVGFPGRRTGREFLRLWAYEAAGRRGNDQSALNVVLHRAYPDDYIYLPGCTFWPDTSGCLCHFLGRKEEMLGEMRGEMLNAE